MKGDKPSAPQPVRSEPLQRLPTNHTPSKDVAVECSEGKEMSEASPDSLPDGVKGHELQVKITMKKISVTR